MALPASDSSVRWNVTGVLRSWHTRMTSPLGVGAVLAKLVAAGAQASVVSLSPDEASTLHAGPSELAAIRSRELQDATSGLHLSRGSSCTVTPTAVSPRYRWTSWRPACAG
jgi:hypothetical protein